MRGVGERSKARWLPARGNHPRVWLPELVCHLVARVTPQPGPISKTVHDGKETQHFSRGDERLYVTPAGVAKRGRVGRIVPEEKMR